MNYEEIVKKTVNRAKIVHEALRSEKYFGLTTDEAKANLLFAFVQMIDLKDYHENKGK